MRITTGSNIQTFSLSHGDGQLAYAVYTAQANGGQIDVVPADSGSVRLVYQPRTSDAHAAKVIWARDGRALYFKSHDHEGRAALWSIPTSGGAPRVLIRFTDPNRLSNRPDFDTDGRRFFFTIEDRQSNLWVADLERR